MCAIDGVKTPTLQLRKNDVPPPPFSQNRLWR